jgi:hypothetical protein
LDQSNNQRFVLKQAILTNAGRLGVLAYRLEERPATPEEIAELRALLGERKTLQSQLALLDAAARPAEGQPA